LSSITLETKEKMGGRKKTKDAVQEENERSGLNADDLQNPELVEAGQPAGNLRIRASPYQELACGRLKRKGGCLATDSSSDSTAGGVQATLELRKDKPIKPLRVIQHHFSNGERMRTGRRGATSEDAETIDQESQNVGNDEGVRATPKDLMYKDTRSGKWRTTARQPRQYDYRPGSGGGQRPGNKSRHTSEGHTSDFRSQDQTVFHNKKEDRRGRGEGEESHHLCIGFACKNPGCQTKLEFRNTSSTSLTIQHRKANKEATAFRRRSALAYECHEYHEFIGDDEASHNLGQTFSHPPADGTGAGSLQPHQTPLLSMREMIGSLHPGVHNLGVDVESEGPPTGTAQIEQDEAANIFSKAILRENHDEPHTDRPPSCVLHPFDSVTSRQGPSLGITRYPSSTR
jgi:hypothetical protein